jgi:hypothetical protein
LAAEQLAEAVRAHRLRPDTLVWTAGMAAWQPASAVNALAHLFPPPVG